MSINETDIAKLEARVRALEAIIEELATVVVTQEVLEAAKDQIVNRRYDHPLAITDMPPAKKRALEDKALNEIWLRVKDPAD